MGFESSWRVFLGSFLLLAVSFVIYLVRYPLWFSLRYVELIFVMLTLSYLGVFVLALFLLKKDSKKPLSDVFRTSGRSTVFAGMVFAVLYLGIWYSISFAIGSRFELASFPSLSGYENYSVYLLSLAFALQLVFTVFGAFAEEVAYRGYVQTRISSRYGLITGIFTSTLLFSLQHIHIFQLGWVASFFQTQFLHVVLFGVFVGYLFFKSKENLWGVFSFHALINVFSVSVPIVATASLPFAGQLVDVPSFAIAIILIHYLL